MIIDVDAFTGHYPFRRLQFTQAGELVKHLESHGIGAALVSSLHSVFYRDVQQGNDELFAAVKPYGGRLFPVATINPKYVAWERDLEDAVKVHKATAVTLYPEHHGYRLSDEFGQAALKRIEELDIPLVLTQRLEDRRQRHHWDIAEDLTFISLLETAKAFPKLRFVLNSWLDLDGEKMRQAGLRGRCLISFARLHVLSSKHVPKLIDALGVESIAFGSHAPFDYLGPSLVKLANLAGLMPDDLEQIAWKNAASFLRINI